MDEKGRHACKATYAFPVNSSLDESDIESSDKEEPLTKVFQKCEKQRETSSNEDDIYPWWNLKRECIKKTELTN